VPEGSLVVLSVRLTRDGAPWLGGAPVIVSAG
jgi:hypothetical protein